uniref:Uncharacterized protein n=1 Tax=viral metagenome TaxID=1070528 RepID=A0A6H1ZNL2_9ZZZZ
MSEYEDNFKIILKQRQDIEELNAVRSKFQNEIEAKREEARIQTEKDCVALKEKAQEQANIIISQTKEALAKANQQVEHAKAERKTVAGEREALNSMAQELADKEKTLAEWKVSETKRLESEYGKIKVAQDNINKVIRDNDSLIHFLNDKKVELDNREFQVKQIADANAQVAKDFANQQVNLNITMDKISKEKKSIQEESRIIKENLIELKKVKEENEKLLTHKSDIVVLEKKKKEVEALLLQQKEDSKALAAKKEKIDEEEKSLKERQQLLVLENRKLDDKIRTIQQLREGMKTDV